MPQTATAPAARTDSLATSGRKVHLVVAGLGVACRTGISKHTSAPVTHLADLPEGGGRDDLLATFAALDLTPARLCGNCFSPKVRALYARHTR